MTYQHLHIIFMFVIANYKQCGNCSDTDQREVTDHDDYRKAMAQLLQNACL